MRGVEEELMAQCGDCAEIIPTASPLFSCTTARHNFCADCVPEKSCHICALQGASTGTESSAGAGRQLPAIPEADASAKKIIAESVDKKILLSPYKNGVHVTKMGCKFSKYGCRKKIKGQQRYQEHALKCLFRPSSCPGSVPPVEELLDQSFNLFNFGSEMEKDLNTAMSSSGDGNEAAELDYSLDDPSAKSKVGGDSGSRQYLVGDTDPWLWTADCMLPTQHESNLILQKELRQLTPSKRKKPEYMQSLRLRLARVCEELVNSL